MIGLSCVRACTAPQEEPRQAGSFGAVQARERRAGLPRTYLGAGKVRKVGVRPALPRSRLHGPGGAGLPRTYLGAVQARKGVDESD